MSAATSGEIGGSCARTSPSRCAAASSTTSRPTTRVPGSVVRSAGAEYPGTGLPYSSAHRAGSATAHARIAMAMRRKRFRDPLAPSVRSASLSASAAASTVSARSL
ncbi:Uncharacterised protein [Mycobacteroides abscessus subsp. abscessus]|nr:Uncharacterised protein [Mycobacteroides abscessus subsp. abscessus]